MYSGRFKERVCIVTGAAQSIGRAIASRLASEGGQVVVADRAEAETLAVVAEIQRAGGVASICLSDLETAEGARTLSAH